MSTPTLPVWCALALAVAFGGSSALACTCREAPAGLKDDALVQWKRDKAEAILRGRIVSLRAGEGVVLAEGKLVTAEMEVEAVDKGALTASGRVQLATGFGVGDCGIPSWMLMAIAWKRTVNIEVRTAPEVPGVFYADMCGYGEMDSISGRKR